MATFHYDDGFDNHFWHWMYGGTGVTRTSGKDTIDITESVRLWGDPALFMIKDELHYDSKSKDLSDFWSFHKNRMKVIDSAAKPSTIANMSKTYSIKTTSPEHRKACIAALIQLGYLWHGEFKWTPASIQASYAYKDYPVLTVDTDGKELAGMPRLYNDEVAHTLDQVIEEILTPSIVVTGVGTHKGNVDVRRGDSVVIIGSQEITFQKILELADAYHKVNK